MSKASAGRRADGETGSGGQDLTGFFRYLAEMPRWRKQVVAVSVDVVLSLLATWLAFSLRLEQYHVPSGYQWLVYLLTSIVFIPIFIRIGLYRAIFRYSGIASLRAVAIAVLLFGMLLFAILFLGAFPGVPRSVSILQPLLFWGFVSLSRIVAAQLLQQLHTGAARRRAALIFGAGDAAAQVAHSLAMSGRFQIFGFVDDQAARHRGKLNGINVYDREAVPGLIDRYQITDVLLALPEAGIEQRRQIVANLVSHNVRVRSIPELARLATGEASVSDLEDLKIVDILERKPIASPGEALTDPLGTVMVTGAGGSIGGELCRQILSLGPVCLVLVDHSEYGLYAIHRELCDLLQGQAKTNIVPCLASVRDSLRMEKLVERYRPQTIYHAAAYKHVPLVEDNALEGITNNVLGTWNLAVAARKFGTERFVLVSTDKAVRPTNVMGASKRLAELLVQALAAEDPDGTIFSMVRFGNVLGSSGSVVPLFSQQIMQGGPLTITHPEVTRYFMTIPEAVSLVLQAGQMAEGGEVFVLDMGEPVKIIDLARKMIRLAGKTERTDADPRGDIAIRFIGLRPGEKLYEELLIGENPLPTRNEHILMAREPFLPLSEIEAALAELRETAANDDSQGCIDVLKRMVVGFCRLEPVEAE
jgi:FlaA1/EpsC-like NDP-sugar epimerase